MRIFIFFSLLKVDLVIKTTTVQGKLAITFQTGIENIIQKHLPLFNVVNLLFSWEASVQSEFDFE